MGPWTYTGKLFHCWYRQYVVLESIGVVIIIGVREQNKTNVE